MTTDPQVIRAGAPVTGEDEMEAAVRVLRSGQATVAEAVLEAAARRSTVPVGAGRPAASV